MLAYSPRFKHVQGAVSVLRRRADAEVPIDESSAFTKPSCNKPFSALTSAELLGCFAARVLQGVAYALRPV
jgi:hypothetical protein